jgi:hypothetical protein
MFVLTLGVAILNRHTRLARLETNAPLLAALGAAMGRRIVTSIHNQPPTAVLKSDTIGFFWRVSQSALLLACLE